jgi:F-type H+-transporting ATPase subunit epsilon
MQIEVLTPEKKLYSGAFNSVIVPGSNGLFEILNNHAAIISTLEKGVVKLTTNEGTQKISIESGVVEVKQNKVIVLVEI